MAENQTLFLALTEICYQIFDSCTSHEEFSEKYVMCMKKHVLVETHSKEKVQDTAVSKDGHADSFLGYGKTPIFQAKFALFIEWSS